MAKLSDPTKFQTITGGKTVQGAVLSREERVKLQFTRIVNYDGANLCEEWGGDFLSHYQVLKIQEGWLKFWQWAEPQEGEHIVRINKRLQWSPRNCNLCERLEERLELGVPTEIWVGCGSEVVPLRTAAKALAIPMGALLKYKLHVILDHLVIGYALGRMLGPRTGW